MINVLISIFLLLFAAMLASIITKFEPSIYYIVFAVAFIGIIIFIFFFRGKSNKSSTGIEENDYLPFILKKSGILRLIFSSLALSVIISILIIPFLLIFVKIDDLIHYIERYFIYQVLFLSLILLPFVRMKLRD